MALQLFPYYLVALRGVTGHGFSPGDHCFFLGIKQRACLVPIPIQCSAFLNTDAESFSVNRRVRRTVLASVGHRRLDVGQIAKAGVGGCAEIGLTYSGD